MSDVGRAAYAVWAPRESPWAAWVKPVLFAHATPVSTVETAAEAAPPMLPATVRADPGTALIINLPGEQAVRTGLAAAQRGFRPVPLFNGCPGNAPVVPVLGIINELIGSMGALEMCALSFDAPPAFLLDSRRKGVVQPSAGSFDNRWLVLPQDFPSAGMLRTQGIGRVVVLTEPGVNLEEDLRHVLFRWQKGQIQILQQTTVDEHAQDVTVQEPRGFGMWFQGLRARFGFRRNSAGGFGSRVPDPSSGGGHAGFYG